MPARISLEVATALVNLDLTLGQIDRLLAKGRNVVEGDEFLTAAAHLFGIHLGQDMSGLPEEWRAGHPEVPWHSIRGFRNRLAHDYLAVDFDILWDTFIVHVPAMRRALGADIEAAREIVQNAEPGQAEGGNPVTSA